MKNTNIIKTKENTVGRVNNKNKLLILLLCSVLLTGGIFAYFTDTETKNNKFTVGNVDIQLREDKWDAHLDVNNNEIPDIAEKITPLKSIDKDPLISNVGTNDAWVYLEVKIPLLKNVVVADTDGNKLPAGDVELFSFTPNSQWTQLGVKELDDIGENMVYVYGYNTSLKNGQSTPTLFDTVKFANIIQKQSLETLEKSVVVIAKAVQTDGTGSMTEAYDKHFKEGDVDAYNITYNYESGTPAAVTNIVYKDYSNYYDEYCIDYGVVDLTDVYKISQTGLDFGSWELYLDERPYESTDYFRDIDISEDMQRKVVAKIYYIGDRLITPSLDLLQTTELKKQYKTSDETFQIPVIDRDNYIFHGWYNNPQFNGSPITQILKGSTNDISLYAKFETFPTKTYTMEIGSYYNDSHLQYESTLPYKYEANSVIFDRGIPNLDGIDYVDVSKNKDKSVIAYIDNNKVVHFVSDGIIALEPNAEGMFGDWKVTSINFNGNIDTSNVTNMRDMFVACGELTHLDLTDFNTSKVENMSSMFYGCHKLTSIKQNFDMTNVADETNMFTNCGTNF